MRVESQQQIEEMFQWLISKVAYNSTILMQGDEMANAIGMYVKNSPDFISDQLFEALNEYKSLKTSNPTTSELVEDVLTFKYFQLVKCTLEEAREYVKVWRVDVLKQLTDSQALPKLNF
jgi:hypothetical protein